MAAKERYRRKESDIIHAEILHLPSRRLVVSYKSIDCHKIYVASQRLGEAGQVHLVDKGDQSVDFRVPHYTNDSCKYLYSISLSGECDQLVRLNLMDDDPGVEVVLEGFNSMPKLDEDFVTHEIINCVDDEVIYLKGCLYRGDGVMVILELNIKALETKVISFLDMDIEMDVEYDGESADDLIG